MSFQPGASPPGPAGAEKDGRGEFKAKGPRGPRVNNRIRVPQVRVIGAGGEQIGIMDTPEALRMAESQGLDLVEV
ncbi:MAG: translation initiation factor IF-3, partial [Planctomycetes bacterium]|nr:translation initiation factor IF-3 [Planctomycetota bacterium]